MTSQLRQRVSAAVVLTVALAAQTGSPARASTPTPRSTVAMETAAGLGEQLTYEAGLDHVSPRSMRNIRELIADARTNSPDYFTISGATDRNRDGLDDDGKLTVTAFANSATLTLGTDGGRVHDDGFHFHNPKSVLRESALNFDRGVRTFSEAPRSTPLMDRVDNWDTTLLSELSGDVPAGVKVTGISDRDHDGIDDDGRVAFTKNGRRVTLTLSQAAGKKGTVSYGTSTTKSRRHRHNGPTHADYVEYNTLLGDAAHLHTAVTGTAQATEVSPRSIALVRDTARHLGLHKAKLSGLLDTDGDGLDDDGVVKLTSKRSGFTTKVSLDPDAASARRRTSFTGLTALTSAR